MTPENIVLAVGVVMIYVVVVAMTGCLPIRPQWLRAIAMVVWPLTVFAALLYLPFLIFRAGEDR